MNYFRKRNNFELNARSVATLSIAFTLFVHPSFAVTPEQEQTKSNSMMPSIDFVPKQDVCFSAQNALNRHDMIFEASDQTNSVTRAVSVEDYLILARSTDEHDADSLEFLGKLLLGGYGLESNPTQALLWFKKAANANSSSSQYVLALMYEHGCGVQVDSAQANRWFMKAADQLYEPALRRLKKGYSFRNQ